MMSAADSGPVSSPPGAGRLGMSIFIASLSMLFAASFIGYLVVRSRAEVWPPPGMPSLPRGLWWSTLILIISSITMQNALSGVRRNSQKAVSIGLLLTLILGLAFLVNQFINWLALREGLLHITVPDTAKLYVFTFYMLTVLHGIHVIGGLIPMSIVTARAFQGRYNSDWHPGVLYCTMYWHFLGVVWLVLFGGLVLAG